MFVPVGGGFLFRVVSLVVTLEMFGGFLFLRAVMRPNVFARAIGGTQMFDKKGR